jgi:hypothetical protein
MVSVTVLRLVGLKQGLFFPGLLRVGIEAETPAGGVVA